MDAIRTDDKVEAFNLTVGKMPVQCSAGFGAANAAGAGAMSVRRRPTSAKKPRKIVSFPGLELVGVARIELATPAMSTQTLVGKRTEILDFIVPNILNI